jgi:hypothetical protein
MLPGAASQEMIDERGVRSAYLPCHGRADRGRGRGRSAGGAPTSLAAIDPETGLLTAAGKGNGRVRVTAESAGKRAVRDFLVTNQLGSDKVTIGGTPMTVDYISLRTGTGFGPTDNIARFKGANQQTAVFGGLFSENRYGYYLPGMYVALPAGALHWAVTDRTGKPTALAVIDGTGLVTATGAGDGDVLVTATLKNNPDIAATRVIAVRNQSHKDPFRMIQGTAYDESSVSATPAGTWGFGGNQFGVQVPMPGGATFTYKNVEFGRRAPREFAIRLAPDSGAVTTATIEVWADAAGAGGTLLGTVTAATSGSNVTYGTYVTPLTARVSGVHDVVLRPSAAVRVNWLAFA